MHPVEIKCHSHSFKMELNLALRDFEDQRSNSNSLQNVQLGWAPATIGFDMKVSKRIVLSAGLFQNREN